MLVLSTNKKKYENDVREVQRIALRMRDVEDIRVGMLSKNSLVQQLGDLYPELHLGDYPITDSTEY